MASLKNIIQDKNGNVSIGTISPESGYKLDVRGNILAYYANVVAQGLVSGYGITEQKIGPDGTSASNKPFVVYTSGGFTNERLRIDTSGNVGIRNSSPESFNSLGGKVLVIGDGTTTNTLTLYSNSTADGNGYGHIAFADGNASASTDQYKGLIQYFHGNDSMRFYTNASTQMTILSTGNVGIGTTSPVKNLVVDKSNAGGAGGYIRVQNEIGGNGSNVGIEFATFSPEYYSASVTSTDPVGRINATDTGAFSGRIDIQVRGTGTGGTLSTVASFDNNGNVGIGTTSPVSILELTDDTPTLTISDTGNNYNDGDVQAVVHLSGRWYSGTANPSADDYSDARMVLRKNHSDGNGGSSLAFETSGAGATGLTEAIRIDKNQNVGIGKTDPSAPLHINGGSTNQVVKIQATTAPYVRFKEGGTDVGFIQFGTDTYISNQKAGTLNFRTNNTDKMTILSDGNVGIGTTSPKAHLHINDGGTYNNTDANNRLFIERDDHAYILMSTPDDKDQGIHFRNTTDNANVGRIAYQHRSTGDSLRFRVGSSSNNNEFLIINSDGSLDFKGYGAGGIKGDATYVLGVDSSGNVVETTTAGVYFGTNTSNGTYTNQWQRVLVIDTGNFDSQGFRLRIEGTGNTSGQSIVAEIEFNFKNQNGAIRARTTVNSYGTHPVDKDDIAVYFDTTNLEATFYFKVTQNYTTPIYSIVSGRIRNYAFYSNVIGDDTALASETNDSITSNLKFQGIVQDQDSGLVGIGTTSPTRKLHVVGGSTYAALLDSDQDYTLGLARSGTEEWWLKTYTDGRFAIHENGVGDKITIKAGGNVGIGTTTPDAPLTVHSSTDPEIRFGYSSTQDHRIQWDSSKVYIHADPENANASSALALYVDGTSRLYIPDSGNVGIGSTAPAAKLNVASTGANAYSSTITKGTNMKGIINALSNNADDMVGIYFGTGTTSEGTHWSGITGSRSQNATDWSTQLNFYTHNEDVANLNDATQKMVIKGSGNVGVGTTDPGAKLDVNSGISSSSIDVIKLTQATNGANKAAASLGLSIQNGGEATNAADLWFTTASGGSLSESMRITSAGNVGIGETNPSYRLSVKTNGDVYSGDFYQADSGTDKYNAVRIRGAMTSAVGYCGIGGSTVANTSFRDSFVVGTQTAHSFNLATSDTARMTIDSSGNVGIGTTSPKAALDVKGRFVVDSKTMTITDAFSDALTVVMSNHTGCYVKITAFGDWANHSSISYLGEFFLNNGTGSYNEPGMIIRQEDNTHNDAIQAQIVDPGGTSGNRNFVIQLKATNTASFTAYITYTIQGMFVSAS